MRQLDNLEGIEKNFVVGRFLRKCNIVIVLFNLIQITIHFKLLKKYELY